MTRFKTNTGILVCATIVSGILSVSSCKSKDKTPPPPPLVKKEKTIPPKPGDKPVKGPIINLADTLEVKRIVLCIKDSSSTAAGLSLKLYNIYNRKLPAFIKTAKLKVSGQPVAWYKSQKAPFFFEAGIPVDKAPAKLAKGIYVKKTGGDSAFVAHFFGPNELSSVGYDALNEFMKDRKKSKAAPPYEVYINNPFDSLANRKIDPYRLQTDIVFPYK